MNLKVQSIEAHQSSFVLFLNLLVSTKWPRSNLKLKDPTTCIMTYQLWTRTAERILADSLKKESFLRRLTLTSHHPVHIRHKLVSVLLKIKGFPSMSIEIKRQLMAFTLILRTHPQDQLILVSSPLCFLSHSK